MGQFQTTKRPPIPTRLLGEDLFSDSQILLRATQNFMDCCNRPNRKPAFPASFDEPRVHSRRI